MRVTGVEPVRHCRAAGFKPAVSTNSTTLAKKNRVSAIPPRPRFAARGICTLTLLAEPPGLNRKCLLFHQSGVFGCLVSRG